MSRDKTSSAFLHRVKEELADVAISEDGHDILSSSIDAYWKAMAFADAGRPALADVVAYPRTTVEVAGLVRLATEFAVPVTTRGLGSGTQGGAMPDRGGLLIDLANMDQVVAFDEVSGTVTVQPGMRGSTLEEWLNERGWFFPHYPASLHLASIGGYLGAKGSGVLSTKYGKIEDLVASIEVVVPPGEIVQTCQVPRHSVGPDLNQVFIGSEGTLGVITEVTLLVRRQPSARLFRLVGFANVQTGVEAVRRALHDGWEPSMLRLYDPDATRDHLSRTLEVPVEGTKLVLAVEGPAPRATVELEGLLATLGSHGGTDEGPEVAEQWWKDRYRYYYPPFNPTLPQIWGTADAVATYANIMGVYEAIGESLAEASSDWSLRLTRHFSHWYPWGTMVYGRFRIDNPPNDVDEAAQLYDEIWRRSSKAILAKGGVINDHHGVGLKLAEDLPTQLGTSWPVLQRMKHAIDPTGVMNPGKLGL